MSGQHYSLEQAQALLPEARDRAQHVRARVAELRGLAEQLRDEPQPGDAVERVAALEAEVEAALLWFETRSIQIKSLSPVLLDFPARAIRDGEAVDVLLCWRDDERDIAYYHSPTGGYPTREPVAMLDHV